MRLLLLNIKTDADDTTLGFTTSWINGLADRCEHVTVVTIHSGTIDVRPNVTVHSLGGEDNLSRLRRVVRFYRVLFQVLKRDRIDVCFAHMTPLLLTLCWPIARLRKIPLLLWYAHGASSLQLRIAERLADRCVTSTEAGFPIPSGKLKVLSQGIDTDRFAPGPATQSRSIPIISVGRITRSKGIDDIIGVISILKAQQRPAAIEITGEPVTPEDHAFLEACIALSQREGVEELISMPGRVPFSDIPPAYRRGVVFLNVGKTGSLDKAILEAMSSGCIPVSSNASFRALALEEGLEDLAPQEDPHDLAEAVSRVLMMEQTELSILSQRCREIVSSKHSLGSLLDQIVVNLRAIQGERRIADS